MAAKSQAREKAVIDGEKFYQGEPCKHGHSGVRYTSNRNCLECAEIQRKSWHKENRERHNQMNKEWRIKNSERSKEQERLRTQARWCKVKDARLFKSHRLYAKDMREKFQTKKNMQKEYGESLHMDHIIPVQGKDVCGLHVPWNLCITTASHNTRKNNSRDEYEPCYSTRTGTILIHSSALPWNLRR